MTDKQLREKVVKQDQEINKLKSFMTRFSNALRSGKTEKDLPATNWAEELELLKAGDSEE